MLRKIINPLIALLTFLLGLMAFTLTNSMNVAQFEKTLEPVIVEPKETRAVENPTHIEDQKESIDKLTSDFDGYFFIIGKPSKQFKDVDYIGVVGKGYYTEGNPPDYGVIYTTNETSPIYDLLKPIIKDRHINFKTKTIDGLRYEFDGNLTDKFFSEAGIDMNDVALTGVLKKIKNGKMVSKHKFNFGWTGGC